MFLFLEREAANFLFGFRRFNVTENALNDVRGIATQAGQSTGHTQISHAEPAYKRLLTFPTCFFPPRWFHASALPPAIAFRRSQPLTRLPRRPSSPFTANLSQWASEIVSRKSCPRGHNGRGQSQRGSSSSILRRLLAGKTSSNTMKCGWRPSKKQSTRSPSRATWWTPPSESSASKTIGR